MHISLRYYLWSWKSAALMRHGSSHLLAFTYSCRCFGIVRHCIHPSHPSMHASSHEPSHNIVIHHIIRQRVTWVVNRTDFSTMLVGPGHPPSTIADDMKVLSRTHTTITITMMHDNHWMMISNIAQWIVQGLLSDDPELEEGQSHRFCRKCNSVCMICWCMWTRSSTFFCCSIQIGETYAYPSLFHMQPVIIPSMYVWLYVCICMNELFD